MKDGACIVDYGMAQITKSHASITDLRILICMSIRLIAISYHYNFDLTQVGIQCNIGDTII